MIIYIEIQKLFSWYVSANPTAGKSQSISYLKEHLKAKLATFLKIQSRKIDIKENPIWIGNEKEENIYDIVTKNEQNATYCNSASTGQATSSQKTSIQEMVVAIIDFIKEKMEFVEKHGKKLS